MTTAEMPRAEGFAEGHDEGRAEGYADGRIDGFVEGVAEVFVDRLTTMGGGRPVPQKVIDYVHMTVRDAVWQLSIDGFKDWLARTQTPEAVEEILESLLSMSPEPAPGEPEPGAGGGEGSRAG